MQTRLTFHGSDLNREAILAELATHGTIETIVSESESSLVVDCEQWAHEAIFDYVDAHGIELSLA